MIHVDVTNRQKLLPIDRKRLKAAARQALGQVGREQGNVSLAIVDDATIAELHGQYLDDPTPTDVLSFTLDSGPDQLEGEVIVSAETAMHNAASYGWPASDELLLYVVHGTLHLAGCLDGTPKERAAMRKLERATLAHFSLSPCYRVRARVSEGS